MAAVHSSRKDMSSLKLSSVEDCLELISKMAFQTERIQSYSFHSLKPSSGTGYISRGRQGFLRWLLASQDPTKEEPEGPYLI